VVAWKIFSLFYKRTTVITSLINEREIIINELETARKEFVTYRDGPKQQTVFKDANTQW